MYWPDKPGDKKT